MSTRGADLDPSRWDPRDPSFRSDPIPWHRALRECSPVHHHPEVGAVPSRYRDVERLLQDERFGVATPNPWREFFATNAPPSLRLISESMLPVIDPPQHTRVRRLVAKAFSPRRVEALRPRLTAMIEGLLDRLNGRPSFDVMDEIAGPFPIMAITELLGVPGTDRRKLHDWTVAVAAIDELPIDLTVIEPAERAADEFLAYAQRVIEARRAAAGDDLISALVLAEDEGEHLTQDELLALIVLLLVAGHDATMSLISTALRLLLHHPEDKGSRHLAFGKGLHFCIGAALARVEGRVVLPALLRRFLDLSLIDAQPRWRPTFVTRQLATLPVNTGR